MRENSGIIPIVRNKDVAQRANCVVQGYMNHIAVDQ